jgi:hypothetical protein
VFDGYYFGIHLTRTMFDTNRGWTTGCISSRRRFRMRKSSAASGRFPGFWTAPNGRCGTTAGSCRNSSTSIRAALCMRAPRG